MSEKLISAQSYRLTSDDIQNLFPEVCFSSLILLRELSDILHILAYYSIQKNQVLKTPHYMIVLPF